MLQGSEYSYLNNQQSNHQIIRNQEDVSQRGREKRERERDKLAKYHFTETADRRHVTGSLTDGLTGMEVIVC